MYVLGDGNGCGKMIGFKILVKWMDSRFLWIECEMGEKEKNQWSLQVSKLGTWKNEVATAEMGKAKGKTGYEGQIRKPVSVL